MSGTNGNNPDFYIAAGDTLPTVDAALFGGSPATPVDLTNVSGVTFEFSSLGGASIFERAATVTDALDGRVSYPWQAGDTNTAATYLGRFHVTFTSGDVQSFPNDRFIEIRVS